MPKLKLLSLLPLFLLFIACQKKPYSVPKNDQQKEWDFLMAKSIAAFLNDMPKNSSYQIKDNIAISGTVIANDKSGNFYRQIIIDDGTAAISLLLDANSLYNDFQIGRKVYLKCKGLFSGYYYKMPQIGYAVQGNGNLVGIPFLLWEQYLLSTELQAVPKAIEVQLEEVASVRNELLGRLIQLNEVQFADTSTLKTYAVAPELSSASIQKISDCKGNSIALRTSSYASFGAQTIPTGKGSIQAIYSVYNNTVQLILRDTSDIDFSQKRCIP